MLKHTAEKLHSPGEWRLIEVHPTFLYESLWNFVLIFVLLIILYRKKFDSEVFATYVFGYGLGRAMIEGLRTDSLYIGIFRVSQIFALITSVAALIYIIKNRIKYSKQDKLHKEN